MDQLGLRERKKRETFARIVASARALVDRSGLDGVTVDEIAAHADVSPRTFFNYFSCKEEAVVGSDANRSAAFAERLRKRPMAEGPVTALRNLVLEPDEDEMLHRWMLRNDLVRRHPELLPYHLVAFDRVTAEFADAVADRLGVDRLVDPRPQVIVTMVISAVRSTMSWWQISDAERGLEDELAALFDRLETMDLGL